METDTMSEMRVLTEGELHAVSGGAIGYCEYGSKEYGNNAWVSIGEGWYQRCICNHENVCDWSDPLKPS